MDALKNSRNTFTVIFFIRKDKIRKDGQAPLNCRITYSGETTNFSIHAKINPNIWDASLNRATGRSKEAVEINNFLDDIQAKLITLHRELFDRFGFVTAEKIRNAFLGQSSDFSMLVDLFQKHIDDIEPLIGINTTRATWLKYKVTKKKLQEFMKLKYNISDISLKELKHQFIVDFEAYMLLNGCSTNTAGKYLQFFKKIVNIARNNGDMVHNPFGNFKISVKQSDRICLTEDELKKIIKKNIPIQRLAQVRDIFVFACYTGLAYIDVKKLTYDELKEGIDKNLWIMSKREKTGVNIRVPLMDIPMQIIDKYKNNNSTENVLPILSNQKMNTYLKELADICGIEKNLTFHLARHRKHCFQLKMSNL